MKVETYACDQCEVKRSDDTNHWFIIAKKDSSLVVKPWSKAPSTEIVSAHAHICGRSCLLNKFHSMLDEL